MTGENQGKSQFMGSEFYEEKEGIKQEESYLPRIFRPSLNLHTFHNVYTAFLCRIFLHKHGK